MIRTTWRLIAPLFITLLCLPLAVSVHAEKPGAPVVNIVTTDFPPYSYRHHATINGMATEVVMATLARAGISYQPPKMQPWARTYKEALKGKNTLIYSIARSAERESQFHWIGKIAPYTIHLYKLADRSDVRVHNLEDAKNYIVGGEFEDIKQAYLKRHGFEVGKNLQLAADDTINLRKLFARRIDLLPFNALSLPFVLQQQKLPLGRLEPVLFLEEISYDLYLAMSKDSDSTLVMRLKTALRELHQNGQFSAIQQRYLGPQIVNGFVDPQARGG
ncbi:MAG: transporter substrate-binding domain-containing protein [Oleiphilaceae bacterium]|nr:transporter substrate-binding domain-containing protein [Oleiphilaceae bacterium]